MKIKTGLGLLLLLFFCLTAKTSSGDTYQLDRSWGSQGEGNGQFDQIVGVAIDPSGRILVGDSFKIQAFEQNGNFIAKIYDGEVRNFTVANNKLYVNDWDRTKVLSLSGQKEVEFGTIGAGAGQFNVSGGIAADPLGNIYVSEPGINPTDTNLNHRIQKFSADGIQIKQWGSSPSVDAQVYYPLFLAISPTGALFVNDENVIRKYSFEGELLGLIRDVKVANIINRFVARGLAFDSQGYLYIAHKGEPSEIFRSDENGNNGLKFGGSGDGEGQFASAGPRGIAVDAAGNVYVGDPGHYKVHKFKPILSSNKRSPTDVTGIPSKASQKKITVKSPLLLPPVKAGNKEKVIGDFPGKLN